METNELQNKTEFLGNAVTFDLELQNGNQSSITVIHNNADISFEEIVRFMNKAIEQARRIKTSKASAGSIRSGKYKAIISYTKKEFDRTPQLNNPYLREYYKV